MLPLARILQMNKSTVVGVQLGQSMMTKSVIEACREYERYLNSQSSTGPNMDINSVISQVGKFKVIPILGDKGSIVAQTGAEIHDNSATAMQDIMDIRNSIVSSVGLLPSYIFGGLEGTAESLKAYVRYLRKLDSIQKSIIHGLKHLSLIELSSRGINEAVPSDISIVFANNISMANIERLEFLDILVGLLNNYTTFINTLSNDPNTADYIDKVEMLSFIKKKLSYLKGAEGAISISEDQEGSSDLTEDTSEIDEILNRLPKDVIKEISNNIDKVKKEIRPIDD
jgi:hypothetical protein